MAKMIKQLNGMIFHPVNTIRKILLNQPARLAVTVFCGFLLSAGLAQWITHFRPVSNGTMALATFYLSELISILAVVFLMSSLFHLTADLLGGAGRGINLFFLSLISLLPLWLSGPLSLLFRLLLHQDATYAFLNGLLLFWSFLLFLVSVKELYRFTFPKAVAVVLMPLTIIAVVSAAFTIWGLNSFLEYTLSIIDRYGVLPL